MIKRISLWSLVVAWHFLGAAIAPGPIHGQQRAGSASVAFRGVVLDSLTGQPVVGAVVRLPDLDRFTVTQSRGGFSIVNVPAGPHNVLLTQLGYAERALRVQLDSAAVFTLSLTPEPVRLDAIVVHNDFLDRMAKRRALWEIKKPFWQVYRRDDIVASGAATAFEFLDETANLWLLPCDRDDPDSDRLCLIAPGDGLRRLNLDNMAGRRPRVVLDGRRVSGGLDGLPDLALGDVYRIEAYGMRGENGIYIYTLGYIQMVTGGVVSPTMVISEEERFDRSFFSDTTRVPRRDGG